MNDSDFYDLIIIGSGAGGGTLARHLSTSGKKILLLERGDWLKREAANWDPKAVFVESRYISPDVWVDGKGKTFQPQVHYFVGGATKMYGAALYRLRKEDFGELKYDDGISPAWPISYEEMEPYYTKAEELYQVHGAAGIDPTEPQRSKPYSYPPISHEPRIQALYDQLKKNGYNPFPAPCAIMLNEKDRAHSRCVRCQTCDGFPCLVQAKADAEMIGVRGALKSPNVRLIIHAKVTKLNTNPEGTSVTEVVADVDGIPTTFRGALIVVSCGAANSAKLLLDSANDRHPKGLANGSDQVGRNYMFHNSQAVLALSSEPNPTFFQKTLSINDFYLGTKKFPYPMGNIQMLGKSLGPMFRGEKPIETALVPKWILNQIAHHSVDFWLSTEDLPDPNNRVTVDRQGRIALNYTPNNQTAKQKLFENFKTMLNSIGNHFFIPRTAYLRTTVPIAGCAHQAGTCRFGKDPKTSVLDLNCKAHELDNLYVVDTSFFPSIGAVNPSLTAIANALRVGDHLLDQMG